MGGMYSFIHNEIHISNIERNTSENIWLDLKFEPGTPESIVMWTDGQIVVTTIYPNFL